MHVAVCRSHNYQHELHLSRGEGVGNVNNKKLIVFKGSYHLQKDFGPAHLRRHDNGKGKKLHVSHKNIRLQIPESIQKIRKMTIHVICTVRGATGILHY